MKPKFYNKKGQLTRYALACGYIERIDKNNIILELWTEGGPLIHVKAFDHNLKIRLFWESFETLTEARNFYDKKRKEIYVIL